ncbi:GNAT family N-acetyltransferase [Ensifer sp. ENS07]|uniref:GNAT family N-acetyltransferase n=1 Tax=Ensifer sp. ENS07 TaxID=2769274 RepID=UPI00353037C0
MGDQFPSNCRIVEKGDLAVGCVTVSQSDGCVHIEQLYIAPTYRNRGFGRAVIEEVLSSARLQGQNVRAQVLADPDILRFFEALGFVATSRTTRTIALAWSAEPNQLNCGGTCND